jgi:hypothetical protein
MERNSTIENGVAPKSPVPKRLLAALVKWTVWVLLAANLLLFIVYMAHSYLANANARISEFQFAVIRFGFFISIVLVFFCVYGIIIGGVYAIRDKKPLRLIGLAGFLAGLIFGALMAFITSFILNAAGGNL